MKRTKVTTKLIKEICELRRGGKSISQIIEITGVCKWTVCKYIKLNGLNKKTHKVISITKVLAYKHLTPREFADKFGYRYSSVTHFLNRHNIKLAKDKVGRKPKPVEPEPEQVIRHKPAYQRFNNGYGIAAELHNW